VDEAQRRSRHLRSTESGSTKSGIAAKRKSRRGTSARAHNGGTVNGSASCPYLSHGAYRFSYGAVIAIAIVITMVKRCYW